MKKDKIKSYKDNKTKNHKDNQEDNKKNNSLENDKKEYNHKKENKVSDKDNDFLIDLQRLQAEFDNYKKRTEREKAEFKEYALNNFIKEILTVIDNFQLALKSHNNKNDEFYKGIELIYAELIGLLKNKGLEEITYNDRFNPQLHEALLTEEKKGIKPNMILEVLQPGYKLKNKVIRPAKVKVSR